MATERPATERLGDGEAGDGEARDGEAGDGEGRTPAYRPYRRDEESPLVCQKILPYFTDQQYEKYSIQKLFFFSFTLNDSNN
jgi:hypothetical protein